MTIEQHNDITLAKKQASLTPGYELAIPESVSALASITMFWQPQMDTNYKSPHIEILAEEHYHKDRNKARRGIIWRQAHKILDSLGVSKSKENVVKIYEQLGNKK